MWARVEEVTDLSKTGYQVENVATKCLIHVHVPFILFFPIYLKMESAFIGGRAQITQSWKFVESLYGFAVSGAGETQ